jgi:hypothetical protein
MSVRRTKHSSCNTLGTLRTSMLGLGSRVQKSQHEFNDKYGRKPISSTRCARNRCARNRCDDLSGFWTFDYRETAMPLLALRGLRIHSLRTSHLLASNRIATRLYNALIHFQDRVKTPAHGFCIRGALFAPHSPQSYAVLYGFDASPHCLPRMALKRKATAKMGDDYKAHCMCVPSALNSSICIANQRLACMQCAQSTIFPCRST